MTTPRLTSLFAAVIFLGLVLLFPPHDQAGLAQTHAFVGFQFVFADAPDRAINGSLLAMEAIAVLATAAIAWRSLDPNRAGRGRGLQTAVLVATGAALVLALLFPPFQYAGAVTNATLPSFDWFYFLFADHADQVLVTSLLWVEVTLILVNGLLVGLMLRPQREPELAPREAIALARELAAGRH